MYGVVISRTDLFFFIKKTRESIALKDIFKIIRLYKLKIVDFQFDLSDRVEPVYYCTATHVDAGGYMYVNLQNFLLLASARL